MQHQEFEPPEALRHVIKCFWHNVREYGEGPASFEVVPDGYAEIIFHFGSACGISPKEGAQPLPSPFLVGLLSHPIRFYIKDRMEVIGIRCFPWTVFDLLGLASDKEEMRLFDHPLARLQPTLEASIHAGAVEEALAQISRFFLSARSEIDRDSMLLAAGEAMTTANGNLPVSQVAAAAYATVRTLERKFKQSAGHTIKDVSGLMRFEQARNRLWLHPDSSLADLAQELGYADQSHLSREFKRYSGTTPAAFARKAKEGRP